MLIKKTGKLQIRKEEILPKSMGFSLFSVVLKIMLIFPKFFKILAEVLRRNCFREKKMARIKAIILELILAKIRNPINANVDSYF